MWHLLIITAVWLMGCAKGSFGSDKLSDFSSLPKVTDPVVGQGSGQYQKMLFHTSGEGSHATMGTRLSDFNSKDWSLDGGLERAACESATVYREVLNNAIESTKIQCYLGAMLSEDKFDGKFHLFDMEGMKDEHQKSFKVKIKATKDSQGHINNFEVFACSDGSQEMHGKQSIDGDKSQISMAFKHIEQRGEESFSHLGNIVAEGGLNAYGQWSSKKVIARMTESGSHYHDFDGTGPTLIQSQSQAVLTLDESSDHILLSGFRDGNFGGENFTERFLTVVGLIVPEDASVLSRQLTDGSAKRIFRHNGHTQGETRQEEAHWTSGLTSAESSHWADLLVGEPPAVQSVSAGFSADQAWDCTGEFERFVVEPSMMQKFEQCEEMEGGQNQWIDCWSHDNYQPPPEPQPKPQPESGSAEELPPPN